MSRSAPSPLPAVAPDAVSDPHPPAEIASGRAVDSPGISRRAEELYREAFRRLAVNTDHRFAWLLLAQWVFAVGLSAVVAPRTWSGEQSQVHPHVYAALFLGAALTLPPVVLAFLQPGRAPTRHLVAASQMLFSALLIHLTGGRIETHFHVFGSLAFLAFYRDEKVLVTATVAVALDHLVRGLYWPESIFGSYVAGGPGVVQLPRVLEHGGWVVFEDVFLFTSILVARREMWRTATDQARVEELNRQITEAQESETIMAAVNQGLFLLDPAGRLGQHPSRALRAIFGLNDLTGRDFVDLLRSMLPEKVCLQAREHLGRLFDRRHAEADLVRVNPLSLVQAYVSGNLAGVGPRMKCLEFTFSRIVSEDGHIVHLLVSVCDVTDRTQLEKELRTAEQRKDLEMELLLSILELDPAQVESFVGVGDGTLRDVTEALRSHDVAPDSAEMSAQLDDVLHGIRWLKGQAASLRLHQFEDLVREMETELQHLRNLTRRDSASMLRLTLKHTALSGALASLQRMVNRLQLYRLDPTMTRA